MAKEAKKKEKKMKDNTNKKDSKKDKRHFFKDVKAELKKVIWPTPKQLLSCNCFCYNSWSNSIPIRSLL